MRSGSPKESTPAPGSDSARSDPAPELGATPDAEASAHVEPQGEPTTEADPESEAPVEPAAERDSDAAPGSDTEPDTAATGSATADSDAAPGSAATPDTATDQPARVGKVKAPSAGLTGGIGCAALLLPLVAVAGAVLCFAAGILSTATGCSPNGSALCSANGAWYSFALPVFISPLAAAVAAIGAVTVRRHRSTWLAVGYGVVFISIIIGLASASTGSG
jgi:hypothetical protein